MTRLSIIIIVLLVSSSAFGAITTMTVYEKDGLTTTNYPLTFGHVFKKGDAVGTVSVKVDGVAVNTQCDIRNQYDDDSIRFAVISLLIPSMPANGSVTLTLESGGTNYNTDPMTKAEIQATNIDAELRLTNLSGSGYSGSLTADLSTAIADDTNLTYWLSGDIATEVIVEQRLNNSLNAVWEARFYPGTSYIRLSHTIENIESYYRGNIDYALDIQQGTPTLSSAYSKSTFTHNYMGRWRKVLWVGAEPPEIEVHYDIEYLISTGHIPSYDTNRTVPEVWLADAYSEWSASDHDIMDPGLITTAYAATGGRKEIGILPRWTVRYLLTMDNRMREMMLNYGELGAGTGIHWRENDPTKSFYGKFINIDDRPKVYTSESYINTAGYDPIGYAAIGTTSTEWIIDRSHCPSYFFVPYLITGDYFYHTEQLYIAAWNLSTMNWNSDWGRALDEGRINDQIRGEAWGFRDLMHAAVIALDGSVEKAYFEDKIANNIEYYTDTATDFPLRHSDDHGYAGADSFTSPPTTVTSPWMEDWRLIVLSEARYLGFDTSSILDELTKFIIGRFTDSGFNPYQGAIYWFPATDGSGTPMDSWSEALSWIADSTKSTCDMSNQYSFMGYARAALAAISDYTGAIAAYNWINTNCPEGTDIYSNNIYDYDPTWALVPSPDGRTMLTEYTPPQSQARAPRIGSSFSGQVR